MPRYHIYFKAQRSANRVSEHTRTIECEHPLEYDSDIERIQEQAAKSVGAESVMLISWRPLVGAERPTE